MLCIKNGRIHDLVKEEPYVADILVKDGKIAAIGEHLEADGAEVMDASGRDVYTNGTLAPDEAVSLAAKVLSEHLNLFIDLSENAKTAEVMVEKQRVEAA